MTSGKVLAICIGPKAGDPMQSVDYVEAIEGAGLHGDRYCRGEGSFSKGAKGTRQVTIMNACFFPGSGFEYIDSRRNLFTEGVELMWLIGRDFQIGEARMRGVRYCDPCMRPSKLSGKKASFKDAFHDRGGLIVEVIKGGLIRVGDAVIPPPKGY